MLVTGMPAAYLIKERAPVQSNTFIEWRLFKDIKFLFIFLSGFIGKLTIRAPGDDADVLHAHSLYLFQSSSCHFTVALSDFHRKSVQHW